MSKNAKFAPRPPKGPRVQTQSAGGRSSTAALSSKKKKLAPTEAGPGLKLGPSKTDTTDFVFYQNPTLTLVCVPHENGIAFSLEAAADLTGIHPDLLRYYWRTGLIEVRRGTPGAGLFVDERALHEIRQIEHYRTHLGVGRRALPLICKLQRESAGQQIELHFLRCP